MGKTAEDYIKEAKEQIAKTLRCDEKEIVFTSGGTESVSYTHLTLPTTERV